jgi:hypothetical protein
LASCYTALVRKLVADHRAAEHMAAGYNRLEEGYIVLVVRMAVLVDFAHSAGLDRNSCVYPPVSYGCI